MAPSNFRRNRDQERRRQRDENGDADASGGAAPAPVPSSLTFDAEMAGAPAPLFALAHPSKHFVPVGGRYYMHFTVPNAKRIPGHNLRLMLHSNGLCVVTLDPSHVLVQSRLLETHLPAINAAIAAGRVNPAAESAATSAATLSSSSAAVSDPLDVSAFEALHAPVRVPAAFVAAMDAAAQSGRVFYRTTAVHAQVKSHRGERCRADATAKLQGKHKRNAMYVQDEMTLCTFEVTPFALRRPDPSGPFEIAVLQPPPPRDRTAARPEGETGPAVPPAANTQPEPMLMTRFKIPVCINAVLLDLNNRIFVGAAPAFLRGQQQQQQQQQSAATDAAASPAEASLAAAGEATAEDGESLAVTDPLGAGYIAIVQPRGDVKFLGRFPRVEGPSPYVYPPFREATRFVNDAFADEA